MRKILKLGLMLLIIIIWNCFNLITVDASSNKDFNEIEDYMETNCTNSTHKFTPLLPLYPFSTTEVIVIEFATNENLKDWGRNIKSNCFDDFSFDFTKDKIYLSMKYRYYMDLGFINLDFYLENTSMITTTLYAYKTEIGIFFSFSKDENIKNLVLDFMFNQNILVEEEYNQSIDKHRLYCEENKIVIKNLPEIQALANPSLVTISGNWYWQDNLNQRHPAQYFLIELYENNKKVSFCYTDVEGYYEFQYSTNKSAEYYVRLVSEGLHVKVRKDLFCKPFFVDSSKFNLNPNESYKNEILIRNGTIDGKAMSVTQALIIGTKYVEEMSETTLSVPYADCLYPRSTSATGSLGIELQQEVWEYWDIALHEYGHVIQEYYYISNSPGGDHNIYVNLIDIYGKDKGTKLAWGEGWPSFFAIIVTKHFANILQDIPRINDETYDGFNFINGKIRQNNFHLEDNTTPGFGEGSEASIARFFYDLYDSARTVEYWDQICISEKALWNIVTHAQVSNFSEFFEFFMSQYPIDDIESLGEILSRERFSAFNLKVSNWIIGRKPIFTWEYIRCENTTYKLYIYDQSNVLQFESPLINTNSYELSEKDWTKILNLSNSVIKWRITVFQNTYPTTGGYMSYTDVHTLPKPIELTECGIYNGSIFNQYSDWYQFIADDSAEYIFESFGETDTVIEIFQFIAGNQSYDHIISSDDDSGDDYNFKISLNLIKNEKLLFRIRISGWESIGDYRLAITKSSHIHNYSYKYVKDDNFTHYAYCSCGEYKKEQHIFFTEKLGHRCVACKYYTEGPITGILKSMSIVMYNDKKKNDFLS